MAIPVPRFCGIVFRKCAAAAPFIDRERDVHAKLAAHYGEDMGGFHEDGAMAGSSVAMSPRDLDDRVAEYTAAGLVQGDHFCVTSALGAGAPTAPEWLRSIGRTLHFSDRPRPGRHHEHTLAWISRVLYARPGYGHVLLAAWGVAPLDASRYRK